MPITASSAPPTAPAISGPMRAISRRISILKHAPIGRRGAASASASRASRVFTRNLYRHGLLGRFIGFGTCGGETVRRRSARHVAGALLCRSSAPISTQVLAPLFDKRFVRWFAPPISLYGLGIPPAQYAALAGAGPGGMSSILRQRVEKLTCAFSLERQLFRVAGARPRPTQRMARGPLPPYLRAEHFDAIRDRTDRAQVHQPLLHRISAQASRHNRPTAMCCSMRRTG